MDTDALVTFYKPQFEAVYSQKNITKLLQIKKVVQSDCPQIAEMFYSAMLSHKEASVFLDADQVETKLKASLQEWIIDLFTPKQNFQLEKVIYKQFKVGKTHARINIPMTFVDYGHRLIKTAVSDSLMNSKISSDELGSSLILINQLLDLSIGLINETYLNDLIQHERGAQSLRIHSSNAYLAYECEQLRSSLFDWFRKLLTALSQQKSVEHQILDIYQTEFGLWIIHRAPLIFISHSEIDRIEDLMLHIQNTVSKAFQGHNEQDWDKYSKAVDKLSEIVSETAWLIDSLAKSVLEQESGRDALTQLFNRRYLPNILSYEIEFNIKQNSEFAVLYLDIDHFKSVNDTYGHDRGDIVLSEIADRLIKSVRAGDYIFRYGGEEFLIVLTNSNRKFALGIADKIRSIIAGEQIKINGVSIPVTVSIGVALTGHNRNYETTISAADKALYQAKARGRNCCVLSET